MTFRGPTKPHIVRGTGGVAAEVGEVYNTIDDLAEGVGMPIIDSVGLTVLDISDIGGTGQALVLAGRNFKNDAENASTIVQPATGTDTLSITANRPGVTPNSYTISFIDSGSGGLAVVVSSSPFGNIQVDWGGATPNLDATLVTAINANTAAGLIVTAAIVGSAGSGTLPTILAPQALTGGRGEDLVVEVAGLAQAVDGIVTDIAVPALVNDNTGAPIAAANGAHAIRVIANGRASNVVQLGAQA